VTAANVVPMRPRRPAVEGDELDAILRVSAVVAEASDLSETLNRIAESASQLLRARGAAILLRQEAMDGVFVAGHYGLSDGYARSLEVVPPLHIVEGAWGVAVRTQRPVCVEDALSDPLTENWRESALRERYRSFMCVPLRPAVDSVIGVINAYRDEPGPWAEHEVELLSFFADHAAIALRTAHLLDQARRQVGGLSLMVRSLRAQAHDHANQLHTVYGMLALGHAEDAKRVIAEIDEENQGTYDRIAARIEVPAVAGFLAAEAAICRASGVSLTLDQRSRLSALPAGISELDAVTVLGNLVHNSIDAVSAVARSRRRIAVALREGDDGTRFVVRDWGTGLMEHDVAWLFQPHTTSKQDHSGIGLTLVRSIVSSARGSVEVERPDSGGLRVVVSFPR
jgi:GAF domain-containing protein